jgi:hypothetical protein
VAVLQPHWRVAAAAARAVRDQSCEDGLAPCVRQARMASRKRSRVHWASIAPLRAVVGAPQQRQTPW